MRNLTKILTSIARMIALALFILFIFSWMNMAPEERASLIAKIDAVTPFDLYKLREKIRTGLRKQIASSDNEVIREGASFLSESLGKDNGLAHILDINCGLPQNKNKQEQTQSKIYQWRDENGKVHFGDKPGSESALDLSEKYKRKEDYISSEIILREAKLPIDSENTIRTSVNKIFAILSDSVQIEQMHQLELRLQIFGTQALFDSYIQNRAPELKYAAGFYLPDENEANVLMQKGDRQTLSVITHESTHVIMANLFGLSPLWLNEGFSQYFQHMKVSGFENTVYPDESALYTLRQLQARSGYSITRHLELNPNDWQQENIYQHYIEAWSLVYFLMSSASGKNLLSEYFGRLSEDRCEIPDSLMFFSNEYPGGLEQLEKDWQNWISKKEIRPHRY